MKNSDEDEEVVQKKPAAVEISEKNENKKNFKKRDRSCRHDKKRSMQRKSNIEYKNSWNEYEKFMTANLEKKKYHRESPHIAIRRSLHLIYDNSIILKMATVENEQSLQRKIKYEVSKVGKNVKIF